MDIAGNYEISISIGSKTSTGKPVSVPINLGMIEGLWITQDMEKLLPTIRIRMADSSGILTHVQPFDSSMNKISVSFSETGASGPSRDSTNHFTFKVFRKTPEHLQGASAVFDATGFLDVRNMFSPSYRRSSKSGQTIKNFLNEIVEDMLDDDYEGPRVSRVNISNQLDIPTPIYQPNWSNSSLIFDLRERLKHGVYNKQIKGDDDVGNYKIFFSVYGGEIHFHCRNWNELVRESVKYRYIYGDKPSKPNVLNVFNCKSYDNYGVFGSLGLKNQKYSYFDYWDSEFKENSVNLDNMQSLTKYHLIDNMDTDESEMIYYGRNSEASVNFEERATSILYNKAQNLSKMWVDTYGNAKIQPGEIIQIEFGHNINEDPTNYQYSGLWMIERVIHILEKSFFTRLLLTRNGVDTERITTLMKAKNVKMQTKITGNDNKAIVLGSNK